MEELHLSGRIGAELLARYVGPRQEVPHYTVSGEIDLGPLMHAKRLDSLRVLRLSNVLTAGRAAALLASPLAQRLELIDLRNNVHLKPTSRSLQDRFAGLILVPPRRSRRRVP